MTSPDLAGFRDAMARHREELGGIIPFLSYTEGSYPPNTAIDPETQRPFDPTVQPVGSGVASAGVQANVFTSPFTRDDDQEWNAVGWFEEGNIVLDISVADSAATADATEVEWMGERYEISDRDVRGVGATAHRVLVFARKR